MKSLSLVRLFASPWTRAHQAPPSMEFSRQEYWSGLPFPSPGDLPNPGIEPRSPTLQADALTSEPPGKPNSGISSNLNLCCCSVTKLCRTLWDTMNCSKPGFPVFHCFLEFAYIHGHWVSDATQPSRPLLPSPFAFNLSQHQGLQWNGSSHQVTNILELQLISCS